MQIMFTAPAFRQSSHHNDGRIFYYENKAEDNTAYRCGVRGGGAEYAGRGGAAQAETMGGILRLHIMANSDSDADQRAKLAVRDAVLEVMGGMRGCESEAEAEAMLMQSGAEVLRAAEDTLKKCGMDYGAQLVIGEFEFPDREYGGVLYPKGKYRALRIILGEGKGHNWWCVMFPAICIDAGEKGEIDIKGLEMKSWIIEKLKSIDGGKLWKKIMRRLG